MLNFAMCSADLTCMNGSTIQLVLEIIHLSFFIHNINSKHDRETTDRELFRNSSDDLQAFLELKLKCCLK